MAWTDWPACTTITHRLAPAMHCGPGWCRQTRCPPPGLDHDRRGQRPKWSRSSSAEMQHSFAANMNRASDSETILD